jgi:hypothetical protein
VALLHGEEPLRTNCVFSRGFGITSDVARDPHLRVYPVGRNVWWLPRATRTRDSPAAKGRPLAAATGELKVLVARRAQLASKHSLQPDKLAGGVAQATIHMPPTFTA